VLNRTDVDARRPVVSFVRRSPRMNASQAMAWERWHTRYLVPGLPRLDAGLKRAPRNPRDEPGLPVAAVQLAPQPPLDLEALFGRTAPLGVEIGSGSGENLAAVAAARPGWNLLGFEVYEKALASTMGRLAKQDADFVKLICADGVGGLELLLEPGSVAEVWTYFPDPWHKARHHKRRLISPDFAALVASRLAPGGRWRLATDWDDYADAIAEVLAGCPGLTDEYAGQATPRPPERSRTKFERRGLDAGRTIHEFSWIKATPEMGQTRTQSAGTAVSGRFGASGIEFVPQSGSLPDSGVADGVGQTRSQSAGTAVSGRFGASGIEFVPESGSPRCAEVPR